MFWNILIKFEGRVLCQDELFIFYMQIKMKKKYDILVRDSPLKMPHLVSVVNSGFIVL